MEHQKIEFSSRFSSCTESCFFLVSFVHRIVFFSGFLRAPNRVFFWFSSCTKSCFFAVFFVHQMVPYFVPLLQRLGKTQSIPVFFSKFQGWGWFLLSSSLCGAGTASASSSSSLSPLRQKIWELPAEVCTQLPPTLGKLSMGIFTSYQLGIWIKTS